MIASLNILVAVNNIQLLDLLSINTDEQVCCHKLLNGSFYLLKRTDIAAREYI